MNEQTTAVAIKEGPSVIADMAKRFNMDKRAFEATLKATVVPANVSNEQFVAFLLVAKQYNLNPITKEIYAFPAKGGGIQPIVGIDGWCNIINSHPQLNGIQFEDKMHEGKLIAITCKIHRKDREHPIECTEYMEECHRKTQPWEQWPARMLRHKALIQCARYAFSFSGIVEQDEAERQEMIDITPPVITPVNGTMTAKQAFGSARAMKDRFNVLKDSILAVKTSAAIDAIMEENKAELATFKAIDEQFYDDFMTIATNRKGILNMQEAEEEEATFTPEEIENHQASGLEPPPEFLRAHGGER